MPDLLRCWLPIDLCGVVLFDTATYAEWAGDDLREKAFGTLTKQLREVQESRAVYIPAPEDTINVRVYTGRKPRPQGFSLFSETYYLRVPSGNLVLTTEIPLFEWNPMATGKTQYSFSVPRGHYQVSASGYIREARQKEAGAFDLYLVTGRGKLDVEYPVVRAAVGLDVQMKRSRKLPEKRLTLGDGFEQPGRTEKLIVEHFLRTWQIGPERRTGRLDS